MDTEIRMRTAAQPNHVGIAVAAILAGVPLSFPQVAQAQESPAAEIPEVRVTGSRIVRQDFESPSPIVTVGSEQLEQTSNVSLEASLNKLPQFVPALSQLVTGEIQPTAQSTPGAATLNLRGLGANRNLVIVDGRRAMPINSSLAIDLNSIPSAAVDRVEVITGGASSTYGADAVGGVVNFILKKNFQGMSFDAQYSQAEEGDAQEYRIAGIMGGNFGENRGNVMIGGEYLKRGDAFLAGRDFYRRRFADPTVVGTDFWWTETSYNTGATAVPANRPSQAAVDALFADKPAGAFISNQHNFFLNDDGTLYASAGQGALNASRGPSAAAPTTPNEPQNPGGTYRYKGPLDGTFRKRTVRGIEQNNLDAYVSTPMTRYSLFARGNYDFSDRLSYFFQGTLSQTDVNTLSQFSPSVGGWSAFIPYGSQRNCQSIGVLNGVCQDSDGAQYAARPTLAAYRPGGAASINCAAVGGCTNTQAFPVPAELALLLNSRPTVNATWNLGEIFDWLPQRSTDNNTTTYQMVTGFEGELPLKDWTYEVYASHGQSSTNTQILGAVSLDRYRAIVTSPNYGRGFVWTQNANELINGIPMGGNFAGARVTCTSGLPIMENFIPTQDCIDALSMPLQNRQRLAQTVYEANIQGAAFNMWAGEVRFAGGVSYRKNDFTYQTDGLTSINNFLDSAVGIFPLGNSIGTTHVREIYAEALVPLIHDIPALRQVNLELGYRYSDYDPSGPVSTYKGLIDWTVTDFLRVRGGHQFASRAPNIGELYSGRTQLFTTAGTPSTDLCSTISPRRFSANPIAAGNTAQSAAAARALCETLMGPTGANQYYNIAPATSLAAGLYQLAGNPDLKAEEAKTWTAGVVLRVPSENELLSSLTLSADYYRIQLSDAIASTTGDQMMQRCFDPSLNPGLSASNFWCQALPRNPDSGALALINAVYSNETIYDTAGIDIQIDWRAALADMGLSSLPGSFNVNFQASILNRFEEKLDANTPVRDWKDYEGPNLTGNTAGGGASYRYRFFTTLGYSNPGWGVSLRHRFVPSIAAANERTNPGGSAVLNGDPLVERTASYQIFDLSGTWNVASGITVRGGVDNLFDKDPPITGANQIARNGMTGGTLTTAGNGIYDPLGRRYYLGLQANF